MKDLKNDANDGFPKSDGEHAIEDMVYCPFNRIHDWYVKWEYRGFVSDYWASEKFILPVLRLP